MAHVVWRVVVKFLTRAPTGGSTGAAAIAKRRVKLAEVHTAKFATLAELKLPEGLRLSPSAVRRPLDPRRRTALTR
jgi:hypothetical protein